MSVLRLTTTPPIGFIWEIHKGAHMKQLNNPYRHAETNIAMVQGVPFPSVDSAAPSALLEKCPAHVQTPLVNATALAADLGVAAIWVKDERTRMNLGSFKALGAAYVIAHDANTSGASDMATALHDRTYVTASAGNHGLSVAAGAKAFGAKAVIYLSETVPAGFAGRLRDKGADVVIAGKDYGASMDAAMKAATDNNWTLLSDSSWEGYTAPSHRLMEGYTVLMDEVFTQIPDAPTHILLQAGVGGLAGAAAAMARAQWGDAPHIIVVEPAFAPAIHDSIAAGHCVFADGPDSDMGRLDCKEPSLIALKGLARDADEFILISEDEAFAAMPILAKHDLACSTSGGAGLAAIIAGLSLAPDARVLAILSEGVS